MKQALVIFIFCITPSSLFSAEPKNILKKIDPLFSNKLFCTAWHQNLSLNKWLDLSSLDVLPSYLLTDLDKINNEMQRFNQSNINTQEAQQRLEKLVDVQTKLLGNFQRCVISQLKPQKNRK